MNNNLNLGRNKTDINISGQKNTVSECSAAALFHLIDLCNQNTLIIDLKKFLQRYCSANIYGYSLNELDLLINEFIKFSSGDIIQADASLARVEAADYRSNLLRELSFIGISYGLNPFSLLKKYAIRQIHLLFIAAYNHKIDDMNFKIALAGGKQKLKHLKIKNSVPGADKWARARELAKQRKARMGG